MNDLRTSAANNDGTNADNAAAADLETIRGKHPPTLRQRVIAALRFAKHPCTRNELISIGCILPGRGERSRHVQDALDALAADGIVSQATAIQPLRGSRPGVAWELDEEIASWKPVRRRKELA